VQPVVLVAVKAIPVQVVTVVGTKNHCNQLIFLFQKVRFQLIWRHFFMLISMIFFFFV
jgi:hypothetical protein